VLDAFLSSELARLSAGVDLPPTPGAAVERLDAFLWDWTMARGATAAAVGAAGDPGAARPAWERPGAGCESSD
jgi:hypothetical protein